jgi:hypothetical protein
VAILLKPLFASLVMTGALYLLMKILPETRLITIGLILVGTVVYAGVSMLIGSLKKDEIVPLLKKLKK